jgi:hypothetical protein
MNTIEDRLRDAFRADADVVRPGSLRPLPARPARYHRGWLALRPSWGRPSGRVVLPLAAAAAVATISVAAVAVVPGLLPGRGSPPAPTIGLGAGYPGGRLTAGRVPKYLVATVYAPHTDALTLEVVSSATGRVTGILAAPKAHRRFESVAVLRNDRTFVAAAVGTACDTWFYRFRLTAHGKPVGLTPLSVGRVPGQLAGPASFAVSRDGRILAYATQKCRMKNITRYFGQIGAINLTTSKTTTWRYRFPAQPSSLSLSANGKLLGFVSNPSNGQHGTSIAYNSAWVLPTGSAAGPLGRRYRKVVGPPDFATGALLSPTGAVTLVMQPAYHRKARPHWQMRLGAYQTATGALIRRWQHFPRLGSLTDEPSLVASASGTQYLVYSWTQQPEKLNLATGRLVTVPGHAVTDPVDVAW